MEGAGDGRFFVYACLGAKGLDCGVAFRLILARSGHLRGELVLESPHLRRRFRRSHLPRIVPWADRGRGRSAHNTAEALQGGKARAGGTSVSVIVMPGGGDRPAPGTQKLR